MAEIIYFPQRWKDNRENKIKLFGMRKVERREKHGRK